MLVGGAERERRDTIAAGKVAVAAARKARRVLWWDALKAKRAWVRDAAAWHKAS